MEKAILHKGMELNWTVEVTQTNEIKSGSKTFCILFNVHIFFWGGGLVSHEYAFFSMVKRNVYIYFLKNIPS